LSDSPPNAPEEAEHRRLLPFRGWWPLAAGILLGIALRLAFSQKPGGAYAAMAGSFIYLAPLGVGAITVFVAERQSRRSWGYYFGAPFVANLLFIAGTMLVMLEGLICAILIVPVFSVFGAMGGVLMGAICRLTNWPKQAVMSFALLPLLAAPIEDRFALPSSLSAVEYSTYVPAAPAQVWRRIVDPGQIQSEQVAQAWVFRIGVPLPVTGALESTPEGRVRRVSMHKQVRFDEVITDWEEARYLRWTYRFDEESFPPNALDDHVRIGGHYFDFVDTSYTLEPAGEGTHLRVRMSYRVSTRFNWYAEPVARWLLGNVAEVNAKYYARQAQVSHRPDDFLK
jgi:uncharacterized protein YndB with AHSA1/START domain